MKPMPTDMLSPAYRKLRFEQLERMAISAVSLYDVYPLYWAVLSQLGKIDMTNQIATVAVGFKRKDPTVYFFYNVNYVASCSDAKLRFALMHEILHVALVHPNRMQGLQPKVCNVAMDLVVNAAGERDYNALKDEEKDAITMLHPPLNCTVHEDGTRTYAPNPKAGQLMFPCLKDVVIRDTTSEEIYHLLMQNQDQVEAILPGDGGFGEGDGEFQPGDHGFWIVDGDGNGNGTPLTDEQKAAMEKLIKSAVEGLGGRDPGDVPGELRRMVEDYRKVRHDWRRDLTLFAQTILQDERESSWRRYNRRLGAASPGHAKKYKAKLLVAVDNSGSIDAATYALFMGHIMVLSELLGEIQVIGVDTRVNFEQVVKDGKIPADMDLSSGGGTEFQPAFDYAKKGGYDGVIYLSDGCGGAPDNLRLPSLFAICPHGQEVPGFRNIHIED